MVLHNQASHHRRTLPVLSVAGMDYVAVLQTYSQVEGVIVLEYATNSDAPVFFG